MSLAGERKGDHMMDTLTGPDGEVTKNVEFRPTLAKTCEPDLPLVPRFGTDMSGQIVEAPPNPTPASASDLGDLGKAEAAIAILNAPDNAAPSGLGRLCLVCGRNRVELDGWCSHYGPPWRCDDCVFRERTGNNGGAPALNREMDAGALEAAVENVSVAIRNLATFQGLKCTDPSGACRDIPALSLTPKETRPLLELLLETIKAKQASLAAPENS